ncbi:hypothetical protein [Saccharopolyspora hordei]|uniref:Uncharacterized protein n=1 Tax=Saccharopolyspora hordei TaxID=1838 RepID=A0A853AH57_9PSEU|nr:hypothetical protein [Saccharopolyspora hordei]NYI81643.1 hypothetical protein [Saccharopolyspora hordei]
MVRREEDRQDERDDEDEVGEKDGSGKLEIKPAQVAGAATASVTAAFLGSRLGVAGTVIGAGMTSVIITVGGALYQRSFERAKDKALIAAEKAKQAAQARTRVQLRESSGEEPEEGATRSPGASSAETKRIEAGMHWPGGEQVVDPDATKRIDASAVAEDVREESPPVDRRRVRRRWLVAAATCALAFVVSMVVVTGFEGITGRSLSGGGGGTTLGQVLHREPREPVAPPTTTEDEEPVETTSRAPESTPEAPPTRPTAPEPTSEAPQPTERPTEETSAERTPTRQPTQSQEPSESVPPTGPFPEPFPG